MIRRYVCSTAHTREMRISMESRGDVANENQSTRIVGIAGPNGAGKTTFAREFLPNDAINRGKLRDTQLFSVRSLGRMGSSTRAGDREK